MDELAGYRAEIDQIDGELVALFQRRMEVVSQVAAYKRERGMEVLQPQREQQVLDKAEALLTDKSLAPAVRQLFETLMAVSRSLQHEALGDDQVLPQVQQWKASPRVVYPGAEGAFSEQAALDFFGQEAAPKALTTFEKAAAAVKAGQADYAVLPIENSTAGSVEETYRLLGVYGLSIVGEQLVRVRHHLLGLPGSKLEDIRQVRSHPQAIAQCHGFLLTHPRMAAVAGINTALCARMVAETGDASAAAIASLRSARQYGLTVLSQDIQDKRYNVTRFIVAAAAPIQVAGADKATIMFCLDNKAGQLARVLTALGRQGMNLTKLESRPIPDTPWAYTFYADIQWTRDRRALYRALEEAGRDAREMRLLGLYQAARKEEDEG